MSTKSYNKLAGAKNIGETSLPSEFITGEPLLSIVFIRRELLLVLTGTVIHKIDSALPYVPNYLRFMCQQ